MILFSILMDLGEYTSSRKHRKVPLCTELGNISFKLLHSSKKTKDNTILVVLPRRDQVCIQVSSIDPTYWHP